MYWREYTNLIYVSILYTKFTALKCECLNTSKKRGKNLSFSSFYKQYAI